MVKSIEQIGSQHVFHVEDIRLIRYNAMIRYNEMIQYMISYVLHISTELFETNN